MMNPWRERSGTEVRGYAGQVIRFREEQCLSRELPVYALRGDTHRDNHSMQRMFQKNGYRHCGTIYLADGSPRMAFEKIVRIQEEMKNDDNTAASPWAEQG